MSKQFGGSGFSCEAFSPQAKVPFEPFRPYCQCCVGHLSRSGYKGNKADARRKNRKESRAKPRYKDHRRNLVEENGWFNKE